MNKLLWLIKTVRLYPFRSFGIITGTFSLAVSILMVLISIPDDLSGDGIFTALLGYVFLGLLVGLFIVGPVLLTLYNILYLVLPHDSEIMYQRSKRMEWITIIFGGLCFLLAAGLYDTHWKADWWEQLYNAELHAPIATWTYPTLIPIAIIAAVGYLALYVARSHPLPPLVIVLSLGGLYLGAALCLILFIQLVKHNWILCVYLGNMLLIFFKVVKELVLQYKDTPTGPNVKLYWLRRLLRKGGNLPLLGLFIAIPLLGIVLAILTLFGQEPDSIIQAWTQTSDWTFSQQTAPPNLPMDQHYLCTVAARGHSGLVKPLRMGKRHGHWVLVNRQLAVANAFEEIIQERTPRLHKVIRTAYDRYGYPIANRIQSPWASDAVWILMKPAEWFFLMVLYLFDCKPENRIAVQYPHSSIPSLNSDTN